MILEPRSLRCRRLREEHHRQRQAGPWASEPVGRHQRRRRESLRIRLPAKLPAPDALARPHRDHIPDSLRDLPCQAASGTQGGQRTGPQQQQTDQPSRRPGVEPQLSAYDHERLLGRAVEEAYDRREHEGELQRLVIIGARAGEKMKSASGRWDWYCNGASTWSACRVWRGRGSSWAQGVS